MAEHDPKNPSADAARTSPPEGDPEVVALLEVLMGRMEVVLGEMESLRNHSTHHGAELTRLLAQLSAENRDLKEKYQALACEMKASMELIQELVESQHAQESKQRQIRKLSRQL